MLRAKFKQKRKDAMHGWENEIGSHLLGKRGDRKHHKKKGAENQTQPKKSTKQNQQ